MVFVEKKPRRTGNYQAGPGRPPGRKNNRTLELEAAVRRAATNLPEAFDGDAHAFLMSVYKNPEFPIEVRILAAGRALRVEKPVLSAVHGRVDVNFNIAERLQAARKRLVDAGRAVHPSHDIDGQVPLLTVQEMEVPINASQAPGDYSASGSSSAHQ